MCVIVENWDKLEEDEKLAKLIESLLEEKKLVVDGKMVVDNSKELFVLFEFIKENFELFNRVFNQLHLY